jgi:hypothetical protein
MIVSPVSAALANVVLILFAVVDVVVKPLPLFTTKPRSRPVTETLPEILPVKLPLILPNTVMLFVVTLGTNHLLKLVYPVMLRMVQDLNHYKLHHQR